jgi:Ca2+-binding EF-hand superfamily protein
MLTITIMTLRKVQDSTGMKTTVEETVKVLRTFDKDQDGQLNSQEFAAFMINFASSANTPLVDMLDFMIVLSSLKENTAAEEEYMDFIGELNKVDSTTYG